MPNNNHDDLHGWVRHKKHIGAAAYKATMNTMNHQYLGSETQHNVYTAELKALHLGVEMLERNDEYG